jgi:hypothetical protein
MQHGSLDAVGKETKIYGVAWVSPDPISFELSSCVETCGVFANHQYVGYVKLMDCSKGNRRRPVFFRELLPKEATLFKIGSHQHLDELMALCKGEAGAGKGEAGAGKGEAGAGKGEAGAGKGEAGAGKRAAPAPFSAAKPPRPPKTAKVASALRPPPPPSTASASDKALCRTALANWESRPNAMITEAAQQGFYESWLAQNVLRAEVEEGVKEAGSAPPPLSPTQPGSE